MDDRRRTLEGGFLVDFIRLGQAIKEVSGSPLTIVAFVICFFGLVFATIWLRTIKVMAQPAVDNVVLGTPMGQKATAEHWYKLKLLRAITAVVLTAMGCLILLGILIVGQNMDSNKKARSMLQGTRDRQLRNYLMDFESSSIDNTDEILDDLLDARPNDVATDQALTDLLSAKLAYFSGKPEETLRLLNWSTIQRFSADHERIRALAWSLAGRASYALGQFDVANKYLRQGLQALPGSCELQYWVALSQDWADMKAIPRISPGRSDQFLGALIKQIGTPQTALEEEILVRAHCGRGFVRWRATSPSARRYFEMAVKLARQSGQSSISLTWQGIAEFGLGLEAEYSKTAPQSHYEAALKCWTESGNNYSIQLYVGLANSRLAEAYVGSDPERAITSSNEALRLLAKFVPDMWLTERERMEMPNSPKTPVDGLIADNSGVPMVHFSLALAALGASEMNLSRTENAEEHLKRASTCVIRLAQNDLLPPVMKSLPIRINFQLGLLAIVGGRRSEGATRLAESFRAYERLGATFPSQETFDYSMAAASAALAALEIRGNPREARRICELGLKALKENPIDGGDALAAKLRDIQTRATKQGSKKVALTNPGPKI